MGCVHSSATRASHAVSTLATTTRGSKGLVPPAAEGTIVPAVSTTRPALATEDVSSQGASRVKDGQQPVLPLHRLREQRISSGLRLHPGLEPLPPRPDTTRRRPGNALLPLQSPLCKTKGPGPPRVASAKSLLHPEYALAAHVLRPNRSAKALGLPQDPRRHKSHAYDETDMFLASPPIERAVSGFLSPICSASASKVFPASGVPRSGTQASDTSLFSGQAYEGVRDEYDMREARLLFDQSGDSLTRSEEEVDSAQTASPARTPLDALTLQHLIDSAAGHSAHGPGADTSVGLPREGAAATGGRVKLYSLDDIALSEYHVESPGRGSARRSVPESNANICASGAPWHPSASVPTAASYNSSDSLRDQILDITPEAPEKGARYRRSSSGSMVAGGRPAAQIVLRDTELHEILRDSQYFHNPSSPDASRTTEADCSLGAPARLSGDYIVDNSGAGFAGAQ